MAKRASKITGDVVKHMPWLAVVLAIYQYYQAAGGIQGFLYDIKNLNMAVLQNQWTKIGMAVAFFGGAGIVSRYVPGKMKYVVEAIMFYFGASQMLDVLQGMYTAPAAVAQGGAVANVEVRGY